jgi:hypothetical protein
MSFLEDSTRFADSLPIKSFEVSFGATSRDENELVGVISSLRIIGSVAHANSLLHTLRAVK